MENLESFKNAQLYFKTWRVERQNILEELRRIRDEIQRQAKIYTIGSITYSIVRLVGGALTIAGIVMAPFTLGTSLALTVAGSATGLASGVASFTHGVVKFWITKQQCNKAMDSLKNHDKTCKKMKEFVLLLKKDIDTIKADITDRHSLDTSNIIEGATLIYGAVSVVKGIANLVQSSQALAVYRITANANEVAKVMRLGAVLDEIIPSELKDVSKEFTRLSAKTLIVIEAVAILIELGTLIYNAVNLGKIHKGKLCSQAEKLQKVIEQMEHEYTVLSDCFNPNHE